MPRQVNSLSSSSSGADKAARVEAKDRTFKIKTEAKDLTQRPSDDVSARLKEKHDNV